MVRWTAAAAAALGAGATLACPSAGEVQRTLTLINAQRAEGVACGGEARGALPALAWSDGAAAAATIYAGQMARERELAHRDHAGRDGGQRLAEAGLHWSAWAENLARGRIGVERLVALWFASPGHCDNLMLSSVSQAGLGCARAASGDDYWALLLWRPENVSRATAPATATARNPPAAAPTPD